MRTVLLVAVGLALLGGVYAAFTLSNSDPAAEPAPSAEAPGSAILTAASSSASSSPAVAPPPTVPAHLNGTTAGRIIALWKDPADPKYSIVFRASSTELFLEETYGGKVVTRGTWSVVDSLEGQNAPQTALPGPYLRVTVPFIIFYSIQELTDTSVVIRRLDADETQRWVRAQQ